MPLGFLVVPLVIDRLRRLLAQSDCLIDWNSKLPALGVWSPCPVVQFCAGLGFLYAVSCLCA